MKSLNKVLDILEVFLTLNDAEIRLSELAKMSNLNKATVYHIVSVLVERGYLAQMERRGKYSLGTKFLGYSAAIKRKSKIRDIALPHLLALNKSIKEAVAVFSWDGEKVMFVDEVHSRPLKITPEPGAHIPLYCSSVGKLALANMTPKDVEKYFNKTELTPQTRNTITDINVLKKQIRVAAKENLAFDDEEMYAKTRSIAGGIRDAGEELVGFIHVLGPTRRLTRSIVKKIAPEIKHCAMEISLDMGYGRK